MHRTPVKSCRSWLGDGQLWTCENSFRVAVRKESEELLLFSAMLYFQGAKIRKISYTTKYFI